jgi:TRAP transporter TAXI family solute receptor
MRSLLCALALAVCGDSAEAQDLTLFTLGSGDVAGSYYASASAICDVINRTERGAIRCSPDPTSGSMYNLSALRSGELDFAYVQSDWHREAVLGTGPYAALGPMENLRSVMSLYGETVTLLVRNESGIDGFADLKDKRVDLGPPSSGRRGTVNRILSALGFVSTDFASVSELPSGNAMESICQGTIDATVLVLGHPNGGVARTIADCGARLVPLSANERSAIILDNPDMQPSAVPAGTYGDSFEAVPSVSVTATIVTRASTDPAIVEVLVRDTLANLPALARLAPVLANLEPAKMRKSGLSAPLHPGAAAAFDAVLGPQP